MWLTDWKYPSLSVWVYNYAYTPTGPSGPLVNPWRYVILHRLRDSSGSATVINRSHSPVTPGFQQAARLIVVFIYTIGHHYWRISPCSTPREQTDNNHRTNTELPLTAILSRFQSPNTNPVILGHKIPCSPSVHYMFSFCSFDVT